MEKDLLLTNEKFKRIREKIESAQNIINSRRTTIIVFGIILLALISYGIGLLLPEDIEFVFCSFAGLSSIIFPIIIANRIDKKIRIQLSQKVASELIVICQNEEWQLGWVMDALNVQYSNSTVFREITGLLNIIPSGDKSINLSSDENIGLRTLRAVMKPYRLGFKEGAEEWTVRITPLTLEFDSVEGKTVDKDDAIHISLDRREANVRMSVVDAKGDIFQQLNGMFFGTFINISSIQEVPGTSSAPEIINGAKFLITRPDASLLRSWLDETPDEIREPVERKVREAMKAANEVMKTAVSVAIRNRGMSLVAWGIIQFVFSNYLEPKWGIAFVIIGLLNLAFPRRALFLVNGLTLVIVGIWNTSLGFVDGNIFWRWFGMAQVLWGGEEIQRFDHYSPANIKRRGKDDRMVKGPK